MGMLLFFVFNNCAAWLPNSVIPLCLQEAPPPWAQFPTWTWPPALPCCHHQLSSRILVPSLAHKRQMPRSPHFTSDLHNTVSHFSLQLPLLNSSMGRELDIRERTIYVGGHKSTQSPHRASGLLAQAHF